LLGHTGGSVGGTSIFQMNPEHNVVVALTINQSSASLAIGRSLMQYFLDALEEGE
jgi:CubicO group peptidase (beta-lactamase class C family)